ncbi:helix-turn-helix transcriptional regulator [Acetobacter sp.]|jgi:phage repressor protein C with HTH and peptisase S24 domain|uniref:helix-turn-helix transcriptional regulator n=1 Tax=Acetobacter sp. TaxID=440 RepID=UPI0025C2A01E|nr:helix-turn-helix transcriptional regulator [Acetobacter sp.]MCH4092513.1 helix-turn-helix transcriptional regulator [Acetobacter sp.]MCI1299647.1 helix-turn-helix transcriptional regulator [Acetobacter sp.]MCI1315473.1 helix-turn-helix transcriptional regulator [Acetobacter sp.]
MSDGRSERVWDAIDRLAMEKGLTPSGLARAAGLDSTALNPSKRRTADGRVRLPRMETMLDLLRAANVSWREFAGSLDGEGHPGQGEPERGLSVGRIRVAAFSRLGSAELFDRAHLPVPHLWAETDSPFADAGSHDYAIRLDSADYEPSFRQGSLLLVTPASLIHKGDRVLCRAQAPLIAIAEQNGEAGWTVTTFGGECLTIPVDSVSPVHRVTAATL